MRLPPDPVDVAPDVTARDAAMAWLSAAAACVERAVACAARGLVEDEERYLALRGRLDAEIREATYDTRIAQIIHDRLARERGTEEWAP